MDSNLLGSEKSEIEVDRYIKNPDLCSDHSLFIIILLIHYCEQTSLQFHQGTG